MMSIIYNMFDWFIMIFSPKFWFMNHPLSRIWDEELNLLMEQNKFEIRSDYTAKIGNRVIWTGNYPYAAFTPYYPVTMDIRPTRRTIRKAHKKMIKDFLSEKEVFREDYSYVRYVQRPWSHRHTRPQ